MGPIDEDWSLDFCRYCQLKRVQDSVLKVNNFLILCKFSCFFFCFFCFWPVESRDKHFLTVIKKPPAWFVKISKKVAETIDNDDDDDDDVLREVHDLLFLFNFFLHRQWRLTGKTACMIWSKICFGNKTKTKTK